MKATCQHWDGIVKTLKKLWHKDFSNLARDLEHYIYLCNPDTLHEVYIYLETNDSELQKEPHYTALVEVLDRRANKITSFWIQENYACTLTHVTGVGTYASMEFRNLSITKTKWVDESWDYQLDYCHEIWEPTDTTSTKTTKKNLPMQKKRKMKNRIKQ